MDTNQLKLLFAKVTVSVTADDIQHGVKSACDHCPIAIAFGRAADTLLKSAGLVAKSRVYGEATGTNVTLAIIVFDPKSGGVVRFLKAWQTPLHAALFMKRFDMGLMVLPFSFVLEEAA